MVSFAEVSPTELLPCRATLAALIEQESSLRKQLVLQPVPPTPDEVVDLLARSASFLELQLWLVGITEAAVACDVRFADDVPRCAERMLGIAQGLTGLDIDKLAQEHQSYFRRGAGGPLPQEIDSRSLHENMVRQAHSAVVSCPIAVLMRLSKSAERPDLAHRCRMAWERLRAAVRRTSAPDDPRVATLGVAYAEGRLTLEEVVTLMAMRPEDVVALLERLGYSRHIDLLGSVPDLQRRLRAAREDRLRRKGAPDPSPSLLAREVVATQRIEDVDARPWVPTATDS